MSEKVSEGQKMREIVIAVAGPRDFNDTRETWLRRAGRRAGVSFRQVKAIWYGEISDPHHRSVRLMQDAAMKRARELAGTYEYAAQRLATIDPDFHCDDVVALIRAARALRGVDSA